MATSNLRRSPRRSGGSSLRVSLAELAAGATAEIVALVPTAPTELLTRLRHLGFRPGTQIIKLRTAPLGDPALYRLLGYDTCLRRREAAYIEVQRVV